MCWSCVDDSATLWWALVLTPLRDLVMTHGVHIYATWYPALFFGCLPAAFGIFPTFGAGTRLKSSVFTSAFISCNAVLPVYFFGPWHERRSGDVEFICGTRGIISDIILKSIGNTRILLKTVPIYAQAQSTMSFFSEQNYTSCTLNGSCNRTYSFWISSKQVALHILNWQGKAGQSETINI